MKKAVKPNSLLLLTLLLLLSQSSSTNWHQRQLHHTPTPHFRQGLSMEEKTRVGSTPPSCYNKCNACHPCMAVQVPSRSISHRAHSPLKTHDTVSMEFSEPSPERGYSNYKPLGWKCRCRNHFYNP